MFLWGLLSAGEKEQAFLEPLLSDVLLWVTQRWIYEIGIPGVLSGGWVALETGIEEKINKGSKPKSGKR